MQDTTKYIYTNQTLVGVEENIVTVKEIFRLQNEEELAKADKRYL